MAYKRICGIYKITNTVNNKIYIGSAISTKERWNQHKRKLKLNKHTNKHLQNAWNKYGDDKFTFKVIEYVEDKEKLIEREQYWIDNLKVCDRTYGYNININASNRLGMKHSEESKQKFREIAKNRKFSEETRRKMSESSKKENLSPDTTLKMSNSLKGRVFSDEHKNKISSSLRNHTVTDEVRKKMSESGKKKTLSQEHKDKIGIKSSGENNKNSKLTENDVMKIKYLIIDGMILKDIAKLFNISYSTIGKIKRNESWKHIKVKEVEDIA